MMDTCWHCGTAFDPDPAVAGIGKALPEGGLLERHGETGTIYHGPSLCGDCCRLPPDKLSVVLMKYWDQRFADQGI